MVVVPPTDAELGPRSGPANPSQDGAVDGDVDERELFRSVFLHMRRFAGPHRDFDDLVQKGLIAVFEALPSFRGEARLSTFVAAICYRTWLKHLRWSGRWLRRFALTPDGTLPDPSDLGHRQTLPSEVLLDRERWRRLYQGLEGVTEKRRAVIVLHDLEGLELEEIAAIVGAPLATVRTRLRDGRKALRRILAEDPYFAGEGSR